MSLSPRVYKKRKKATVELTSLLDLLFVMIFVNLIQQKNVVPNEVKKTPAKKTPVAKVVEKKQEKPIVQKPVKVEISAIFHFHGTEKKPNLPEGQYLMQGIYKSDTGILALGGVSWIKRPNGYDMVPLSGKINPDTNSFTGKIESPWCNVFNLRRVHSSGNTEVSGKWEGYYNCGQGETGLTLTIE